MVKLLELPTELLLQIVSYVAGQDSLDGTPFHGHSKDGDDAVYIAIQDLYNLCLVSHQLRDLAQPLLFQDFDEDHLSGDNRSIITFTRTITLRPDLAACVKVVDTTYPGIEPLVDESHPPESLPSKDLEVFRGLIRDLNVGPEEQRWLKAIESRDLSVFLALLLSRTPNLTTLGLPAAELSMKPVSHLFTQIPSFLSKLKHLIVDGLELFSGYDIATYQEFLTLPILKDLIIDNGDLIEANCPKWTPASLSIELPFFKLCHIDPDSMKRFVRACRSLKSFTLANFSPDPRQGRYGGTPNMQFNASQLYTELLAHKDTFESLHLEENHPDSTKIGSLREFFVLNKVTIQQRLLPPKPQFPASLETLYITDCQTSIRITAQHISDECRKGLLPALKTFTVLTHDITQPIKLPGQRIPTGQTPEECFHSVRNKFTGTGVEFQICPYAIEDDDDDDYYDDEDLDAYEYDYDSDDDYYGSSMGRSGMASALFQALRDSGYDMQHVSS